MKNVLSVAAIVAVAGSTTAASAGWVPDYQHYSIQRIGLWGSEHTATSEVQSSSVTHFNNSGFVSGRSTRYLGNIANGSNTWVFNPGTNTTTQTGLTGTAHTGSAGYQNGATRFQNTAGQSAGYSNRYTGVSTENGRNSWVYNPISSTTVQTGFTGTNWTGSEGYQYSDNTHQNSAGQIAGYSHRVTGANAENGQNIWVYNPSTNTTAQTGLTGAAWTGNTGYQASYSQLQNDAGQVLGYSARIAGDSINNGQNSWVYNPATNATQQSGFTGSDYTGSAGYQYSANRFQNGTGLVAGFSQRISGVNTSAGRVAWVYNPTTSTTVQIGLTGAAWTGSAGFQSGDLQFLNDAGQVAGLSLRVTGVSMTSGINTWVYNPATNTTVQTGLIGAYWTPTGRSQESHNTHQSGSGQVAGYSHRYSPMEQSLGRNTWFYNPATNTTVLTGLIGAAHTDSAGYQWAANQMQNAGGQVAGYSRRYTGVNTEIGRNTWFYNPATNTTVQTGLTGARWTGSAGYQYSDNTHQNDAGQIIGYSNLYVGVSTENGRNSWVYNPLTNTTVQTGLTGATWTGSAGYQFSDNFFLNEAGQAAGTSRRISAVTTNNGQDAWYYDPLTDLTIAITGSVRTSDNYAFSQVNILTDAGFLLGNYTFFEGGLGDGEQRAFIFRPDLGLTDLGNLVNGGLTMNGWSTLQRPDFSDALNIIVGHGYVNGQTSGQSVFVMTIPSPGAAGLFALGGLVAARRRSR